MEHPMKPSDKRKARRCIASADVGAKSHLLTTNRCDGRAEPIRRLKRGTFSADESYQHFSSVNVIAFETVKCCNYMFRTNSLHLSRGKLRLPEIAT